VGSGVVQPTKRLAGKGIALGHPQSSLHNGGAMPGLGTRAVAVALVAIVLGFATGARAGWGPDGVTVRATDAEIPMVVACPGCGRTTSTYFQELAQSIQSHIRHRMPEWRKSYAGVEDMTVAVMGCVVNGPGESKHANIGISLPGTGERPVAPVYIDGEKGPTLKGERIAEEFQELVEQYVARRYARKETTPAEETA